MKAISFYLAYSFIWLITLLPLRILYIISDLIYLLLFHVAKYRRTVVIKNLQNSFPEDSPDRIRHIARKFYSHLSDFFIESIYQINMGEKEHNKRFSIKNPDLLNDYYKAGQSVLLLMSHYGNWEWISILPRFTEHANLAIYKSLQNKSFDSLFIRLRSRYGVVPVPMESTLRTLNAYRTEQRPVILYTLADQRPQWRDKRYWTRFLNQDTPVIIGAEKIAHKFNMAVVYLHIRKLRRGYYEAEFLPLGNRTDKAGDFEITKKYFGKLEDVIREKPEYWMWSHKRWKYTRDQSTDPVDIDQIPT